ncbi:MAG: hypothetical protein QM674_11565 [Burkholderiaceae bacterium]
MKLIDRVAVRRGVMAAVFVQVSVLLACSTLGPAGDQPSAFRASAPAECARVITAEVVALEQSIVLNRLGAFNPSGMLFALREDVVMEDGSALSDDEWDRAPGHVQLRAGKRPRPLVLRANEGDCLHVTLHNLLAPAVDEQRSGGPAIYGGKVVAHSEDPPGIVYPNDGKTGRELVEPMAISNDSPWTRGVTFHVTGLEYRSIDPRECPRATAARPWVCGHGQGDVGRNESVVHPSTAESLRSALLAQGGTIKPGQSGVYRFRARREGTYFAYSNGATVGGEGDGGQLGQGLFGAVNVQPRNSVWYRSQVTHDELRQATRVSGTPGHPYRELMYDTARHESGPLRGRPILAILDGLRIVHSDVNAVVALRGAAPDHDDTTGPNSRCSDYAIGNRCGHAYREFTVILHDEVKAVQAFAELEDEDNPLAYLKDGMGINYGTGGMGAMVIARNRKTGPAKDCPECRAEEFFLSSWVNGDPALVLKWDAAGKQPRGALYPDDPSNVHHSYLNDPVRFRNLHAGPKETHVFHLHAHQWLMDVSQPGSSYLDSQTISPGAGFSYEISFGGSGNRNLSPGDSIFHCHLYPHFAQGMWELWRVHDVFEDGTPGLYDAQRNPGGRNLPDAEVATGIENPAVVPLPGMPLPPMPTEAFRGYPFYIAAEAGHRPPQPPLDIDVDESGKTIDGGLPRHHLSSGGGAGANRTRPALSETRLVNQDVVDEALSKGGLAARLNAAKVYAQNPRALTALAEVWESIGSVVFPPHEGSADERRAMAFHAGRATGGGLRPVESAQAQAAPPDWRETRRGYRTDRASTVAGQAAPSDEPVFWVNGKEPQPGAPYADPCRDGAPQRGYKAAYVQTEITVNKHGWFDPQARMVALEQDVKDVIDPVTRVKMPEPLFFRANSGDCITFKASNFMPNAMALDDFQVYTPTDTIGQHIHLVKFDVTSSDGSGNGWNYEDGTFSPDEVRERVRAINHANAAAGRPDRLALKTHPLFAVPCASGDELCRALASQGRCPADAATMDPHALRRDHPLCGAQRTVQRWYADPLLNGRKDQTLRTVFSHDHFGPSTHQQHGLYAALVVEPANSVWLPIDRARLDWDALCAAPPEQRGRQLIGGANLAAKYDAACRPRADVAVDSAEPREPVRLRDDGGPTATRANIIAPKCQGRLDSSPANPAWATNGAGDCAGGGENDQTRREFMLAFADFGIVYNTALEPINPEKRDTSALRLGRRFVARNLATPLGIASEDPGTQFVNYRHEPVPLRIADVRRDTVEPELGGFRYSQTSCANKPDDRSRLTCTGDMANVMSTQAHAQRDLALASQDYRRFIGSPGVPFTELVSRQTRASLTASGAKDLDGRPLASKLGAALELVEQWRHDFHCALMPERTPSRTVLSACRDGLKRGDPWREFGDPATPILPAYEGDRVQLRLIQGAQEAQHVFAMNGVRWLREPDHRKSGYVAAQPLGISEHFEFDVRPAPLEAPRLDYLYYGSSVDQLWDGMWGVMRVFGRSDPQMSGDPKLNVQSGLASLFADDGGPLPAPALSKWADAGSMVCVGAPKRDFDVAAVRACELAGDCGDPRRPARAGLVYNQRQALGDPDAIVYVNVAGPRASGLRSDESNAQALTRLRAEYASGERRLEPLVLHAAAGSCVRVRLRNLLRETLPDGPLSNADGSPHTAHYHDNFLSMITDGFNVNQFRMSASVGLSVPLVAQHVIDADGSNVGINSREVSMARNGARWQGSLVPPCKDQGPCEQVSALMNWYLGEFDSGADGAPVLTPIEYGVLPLRSFGDPIKHPMHGLVGALVVGPAGSRPCTDAEYRDASEREADRGTALSMNICREDGRDLYRDLVAVLQDAVPLRQQGSRIGNLSGAEEPDDYGSKAVNYRTEPMWARRGGDPSMSFEERNEFDYSHALSSKGFKAASGELMCRAGIRAMTRAQWDRRFGARALTERQWQDAACDGETPTFVAAAGRELRLRLVHPGGHTRQQAVSLAGHAFNPFPFESGSHRFFETAEQALADAWIVQGQVNGIGPMTGANLLVNAGGQEGLPIDYLWRSQASFLFDGGVWGLLRVVPAKR